MDLEKARPLLAAMYEGEALDRAEALLRKLCDRWQPFSRPAGENGLNQTDVVLIAYGDAIHTFGEPPLRTLRGFLNSYCADTITNLHLLPICPHTSDDGFSVTDYRTVDPALGGWEDVEALGNSLGLMLDAVVNHTSRSHEWFHRCLAGEEPYRNYYLRCNPEADYSTVIRPRALPLLTEFPAADGPHYFWTTFSEDQVDVNFACPELLCEILDILLFYAGKGARFLRLDAVGFIWKEPGTSCLHLPGAHAIVKLARLVLDALFPGVMIITETNVPHRDNIRYLGNGDEARLVYQFPLPPLVLHTLLTGDSTALNGWAAGLDGTPLPEGCAYFNFLASHDGIGLRPAEGILTAGQIDFLVERTLAHGGRIGYSHGPGGKSPYELNISYMDALTAPTAGKEERVARFLAAQAILLALQGIPGIYYHSLLGSRNWSEGVERSGINRRINREKLELAALESELKQPGSLRAACFTGYLRLLRVRAQYGDFSPEAPQRVVDFGPRVFALRRGRILTLVNITGDRIPLVLPATGKDLLSGRFRQKQEALEPYQICWLLQDECGPLANTADIR